MRHRSLLQLEGTAVTLPLTQLLLLHRYKGVLIDELSPDLVPADLETAYRVQTETAMALGPVGAWKVQPLPERGEPVASPILNSVVFGDNVSLDLSRFADPGIEAEIAVTLNRDLPLRGADYGVDDMRGAVGSLHLAIEVVVSRFLDRTKQSALVGIADLQNNGAVIVGPARSAGTWPELGRQSISMAVDRTDIGHVAEGATTANVLRSLAWLANHAAKRGLALKTGDVIITGARIGSLPLHGKNVTVEAEGFAPVSASFV
jgi:2-keto-4-pentenoate hydratase